MQLSRTTCLVLLCFTVAVAVQCVQASIVCTNQCHYVRAGAKGGNHDGTDWANAWKQIPNNLQRGHVYWIAQGDYRNKSYTFDDPVSGSLEITLKKATVAEHGTNAGWIDSYATGPARFVPISFVTSYYNWDGSTGGGPSSWISGFGFNITSPGDGEGLIYLFDGANHISVSHTEASATRETKIATFKGTLGTNTNLHIDSCYFHSVFGVIFHVKGWRDTVIENCFLYDNHNSEDWHAEGISIGGVTNNITVRNNIWHKIEGTAIIAGINDGNNTNWFVYNNLFTGSYGPLFRIEYQSTNTQHMYGLRFYHNTITNIWGSTGGVVVFNGSDNVVENNMWYKNDVNSIQSWALSRYNWYYGNYRDDVQPPLSMDQDGLDGDEGTGQLGTGNPFINWDGISNPAGAGVDFRLKSHTTAGANLGATYRRDMFNVIRGPAWDRGATTVPPA